MICQPPEPWLTANHGILKFELCRVPHTHTERHRNDIITCNSCVALIGRWPAIFLWLKFEVQCTSRRPYREREYHDWARNHKVRAMSQRETENSKFAIHFWCQSENSGVPPSVDSEHWAKVEAKALSVDARAPNIRTSSLIKIIILLWI